MKHEYQNLILIYKDISQKHKEKSKKKSAVKLLDLIESYDISSPSTTQMLEKYQKKI